MHRSGVAVPAEISVVGYDDSSLAGLAYIDLTTVAQDTERLTTLAVARAIDRLDHTPVARRDQIVPPRLVIRGTTAPPVTPDHHPAGDSGHHPAGDSGHHPAGNSGPPPRQ